VDVKPLRRTIEQLLEDQPNDQRLRDHLEGLARDPLFPGLTYFWGPRLYARSRATFRPFILSRFSDWIRTADNRWKRILWEDHRDELEAWLQAARSARDVVLVRRLLQWRYAAPKHWGIDLDRWRPALIDAYETAATPAARAIVLDEFNTSFQLDEPSAIRLYEIDRAAAPFILRHLPYVGWNKKEREMWDELGARARTNGDEPFYFSLYRKFMPIARWREEVLGLAAFLSDPDTLNRALEVRHIEGYQIKHVDTVIELLERRGRDVMPYVHAKLAQVITGWGRENEAERLMELAARRGWWDLWAATARVGPTKVFGTAVAVIVDDNAMPDETARERLRALAGVSREWNWPGLGLARIHQLGDDVACRVYDKFPDLIRGPLRLHVTPRWWGKGYSKLVKRAQAAGDIELIDMLAARYATTISWSQRRNPDKTDEVTETTSALAAYYQAIRDRDREEFARRSSSVLTRIPAYATFSQNYLLRTNALARLMFVRSLDSFLSVPLAVQDLIEGSNIHVMVLAYRVLALPDARARTLAAANVDILLGTVLRPLHRRTRLAAFDALVNAARGDAAVAARIHARAREALKLPDKRYPKAELIGLIAGILAVRPELAGEAEQPVIYRRAVGQAA
jgi:hypothetical protein